MATDVEKLIEKLLAKHPRAEQVDALCGAGEELVASEDLAGAMACFDRGLKVDPRSPRAWTGRATVLSRRGRQGEALGCLDRALDIEPAHPRALVSKADVLLKMGLRDEALACYDRATEATPEVSHVWINRARMLEEMGRENDALEAYEKALALAESPTLRARQADLLQKMGRTASAVKALERAVQTDPDTPDWWFRLGVAQSNLRSDVDARKALERFLSLAPKDVRASQARTMLDQMARHAVVPSSKEPPAPFDADEEAEEVERLAREVVRKDGDDDDEEEDDWLTEQRPSPARASEDESAGDASTSEDDPDGSSVDARFEEAQTLMLLGRNVEALRILEALLKEGVSTIEVILLRGHVLSALGEHVASQRSAERALEIDPKHAGAQRLLARALIEDRQEARALDVAEKLIEQHGHDSEAHRLRGRALVASGRHVESVYAFEKAVMYAPEDAESWFVLGRTLRLLRRFDAARDALTKARGFAKATRPELVGPIEALLEKLA